MAKEAALVIADTHINSQAALCKPGLIRDDGSTNSLNVVQKWLWPVWNKCLDTAFELMKGYHIHLVLNGDILDYDIRGRSHQMISRNEATIKRHTIEILEPVRAKCNTLFVVRGTEAHVGLSGSGEEDIARDLGAEPDPGTKMSSWWHLRAEFSGVSFDFAHHYSMGGLPWTEKNANKLAFETMCDYIEWGEKPPKVVVRSHMHRFADSGRNYDTRAVFTPAWQWANAYMHRLGKANKRPHIGALVFLCDAGDYQFHDLRYRPVRSKPWKLSRKILKSQKQS